MFGMDQKGVFSLPTEPRQGRNRFFHQRGRVDRDPIFSAPGNNGFLRKVFEVIPEDLVIVLSLGIGGDSATSEGGGRLATGESGYDDSSGGGIVGGWIHANFRGFGHPMHFPVVGELQPFRKMLGLLGCFGPGDTDGI